MERLANVVIKALEPHAYLRPGAFACRLMTASEQTTYDKIQSDEGSGSRIESEGEPGYNDVDNLINLLRIYRGGLTLRQQVFADALDEGLIRPDEAYAQLGGDEALREATLVIHIVLKEHEQCPDGSIESSDGV